MQFLIIFLLLVYIVGYSFILGGVLEYVFNKLNIKYIKTMNVRVWIYYFFFTILIIILNFYMLRHIYEVKIVDSLSYDNYWAGQLYLQFYMLQSSFYFVICNMYSYKVITTDIELLKETKVYMFKIISVIILLLSFIYTYIFNDILYAPSILNVQDLKFIVLSLIILFSIIHMSILKKILRLNLDKNIDTYKRKSKIKNYKFLKSQFMYLITLPLFLIIITSVFSLFIYYVSNSLFSIQVFSKSIYIYLLVFSKTFFISCSCFIVFSSVVCYKSISRDYVSKVRIKNYAYNLLPIIFMILALIYPIIYVYILKNTLVVYTRYVIGLEGLFYFLIMLSTFIILNKVTTVNYFIKTFFWPFTSLSIVILIIYKVLSISRYMNFNVNLLIYIFYNILCLALMYFIISLCILLVVVIKNKNMMKTNKLTIKELYIFICTVLLVFGLFITLIVVGAVYQGENTSIRSVKVVDKLYSNFYEKNRKDN